MQERRELSKNQRGNGLLEKLPFAAEAVIEYGVFIAALNRCASQKQGLRRVFQQSV
jgi:hypothetical protein